MPPEVSNYIVDAYVRLRKQSKDEEEQNKSHTYTSARTLLGVLRLAQALGRLRFSDVVEYGDVDEALRLMECSKESLQDDADKDHEPDKSAMSQIFRLIKAMAGARGGRPNKRQKRFGRGPGRERDMDVDDEDEDNEEELSMVDIRARISTAGFTEAQLMQTIVAVCRFAPFIKGLVLTTYFLVRGIRRLVAGGQRFQAEVLVNGVLRFSGIMYYIRLYFRSSC